MPKRILFLADANGLWTERYLTYVLIQNHCNVVLSPIWENATTYRPQYLAQGITLYDAPKNTSLLSRIPYVRKHIKVRATVRDLITLGPYDAVHCQYLCAKDLAVGATIASHFGVPLVATFLGSDLMRASKRNLLRMKKHLRQANAITVGNSAHQIRMQEVFGDDITDKCRIIHAGQHYYQPIDDLRNAHSKADCKAMLGIAPDQFVVSVGYSASSAQQQLSVLRALKDLPQKTLQSITIVLQHTYTHNDADYEQKTIDCANNLGCNVLVLTDFMDDHQTAILRLATDVFIHAITTDAFSVSMQEYLYAQAIVLKGGWLPYPQLESMGIQLTSFDTFADLPALLKKAMNGDLSPLTSEQCAQFPALYSWEVATPKWFDCYTNKSTL